MRGLVVVEGPFDRLRANGFGRGAYNGEWGIRRGAGVPRAAPLPWVPARAGTTMGRVVGCVGARGWCQGGGPLSRAGGSRTAPTTGVGRTRAGVMRGLLVVEGPLRVPSGQASTGSGRTGLGSARAVGSGGCDGGRGCLAPRPCPGFPRERERRWGVWWDALARGVRVRVGGPWPALAGGRFANRPYDRGVCGVAGMRGGPLRVPSGQAQSERVWEGRVRWGVGDAMGGFCQVIEVLAVNQHNCTHKQKTPAPGVSTCEPKGRGGSHSIVGKLLRSVKPSTSGGGILRLGRMWSPGPGRRPIRSPRWRRRGRGRCRRLGRR